MGGQIIKLHFIQRELIRTKSVTSTGEVFRIIGGKIDQQTSTIQMGEMDEGNDTDKNLGRRSARSNI